MIISKKDLKELTDSRHSSPHDVLGMHPVVYNGSKGLVVRAYLSDANSCEVVRIDKKKEQRFPLERIEDSNLFEGFIEKVSDVFPYRLRVERSNGEIRQFYDPYSFEPTLGEMDLHFFNEGTDIRVHHKLGSHIQAVNGVMGVSFAVWAPSAQCVSVVGDFNNWDGHYHPMRRLGASGVWELFIPGLQQGMKYKYAIISQHGKAVLKSDPYATYYEAPPHNASIIHEVDDDDYEWGDSKWMAARKKKNWEETPISVYEVHALSWKRVPEDGSRPLTYREMAHELRDYVLEQGFTHVEFMPLSEHPFDGSWGYQVTGFFAPTHRYGTPQDFKYMVDMLHQAGIGVIMDWVPAHFPKDAFALAEFDGTCLYEHADPRQGYHHDWGTLIFNYGRCEVMCFLVASALAWLERYHIDALRVDAVASMLYLDYSRKEGEWIPNMYGGNHNLEAMAFLRRVNDLVHTEHPGTLMIAEESTAFPGLTRATSDNNGIGFDFKWNMGWMNDTLEYMKHNPIHRKYHHNQLTFGAMYQFTEKFMQVFSHDEVVHGKQSMILKMGAWEMSEKAANLRALYGLMWGWPGKKILFMGQEWGQSSEWNYDTSLDWHLLEYQDHKGLQTLIADLNKLYTSQPGLYKKDVSWEGFEWINYTDWEQSVISFLRKGNREADTFLVVVNMTPVERSNYRLGVPFEGYWKEVLNTDATMYGGHGAGNLGGKATDEQSWDNHDHSLSLTLPSLSTLIFKYSGKKLPKE